MKTLEAAAARARRVSTLAAAVLCVWGAMAGAASAATWKTATWGRGWVTVGSVENDGNGHMVRILSGQIEDTKTDGYCVYLRVRLSGKSWPGESERSFIKSCGAVASFEYWEAASVAGIRLYRDNGSYLTLWGS